MNQRNHNDAVVPVHQNALSKSCTVIYGISIHVVFKQSCSACRLQKQASLRLLGQGNNFSFAGTVLARGASVLAEHRQLSAFEITRPTCFHCYTAGAFSRHKVLHGCIHYA